MPQNSSPDVVFSPQVLEGFLRKIYDGFDSSQEIEPTAWREVLRILNEGAVEGLSSSSFQDYDANFLRNIRHSNEVFSAFKVHSMGKLMQERLLDEEGKLRPFKEWKKAVAPISNHYVGSWLKTEYDTAIIRAHQASEWQEFEASKDIFPNLRWMPTTSPSPEVMHKGFANAKLTKPVNDPFWEHHHPGNRWNCKCSLSATDEPVTEDIDDVDTKKPTAQRGLENNPKDGQLFSNKHPYFPENCNACPFYRRGKGVKNWVKGLLENRKKDCSKCPHIDFEVAKTKHKENYEEYLKYLQNPDYKDVEFDTKTGGVQATHKEHRLDRNKGSYEKGAQFAGYKEGHIVVLEKEDHTILGKKNTDGYWDKQKFEIAGAETATPQNIRNALKHCAKKPDTEVAVIYFPNNNFDEDTFYQALGMYTGLHKDPKQYKEFNVIYCISKMPDGTDKIVFAL